jgi:prolipoprotein diacylglyceryltransferase
MTQLIFFIIGFLIVTYVSWKQAKEKLYSERVLFDTVLLVSLGAIVGARFFYIVFHQTEFGLNILKWVLFGFFPGFSYAGALMGSAVVLYLISGKKMYMPFQDLVDVLTKSILITFPIVLILHLLFSPESGNVFSQQRTVLGLSMISFPITLFRLIGICVTYFSLFILRKRNILFKGGSYSVFVWTTIILGNLFIDFFKKSDVYYWKLSVDQWIYTVLLIILSIVISFIVGQKALLYKK